MRSTTAQPLSLDKAWRKAGKQLVDGRGAVDRLHLRRLLHADPTLGLEVLQSSLGPWEIFWIGFYGFATYGNAGFMREQVCKYMCPYARFQSAMFDKDTLIVTYDAERGEPRGPRSRKADPAKLNLGACTDCTCACRSARPASTSARACSTSASAAAPVPTSATR
jgi:polyferredoxin